MNGEISMVRNKEIYDLFGCISNKDTTGHTTLERTTRVIWNRAQG